MEPDEVMEDVVLPMLVSPLSPDEIFPLELMLAEPDKL